MPAPLPVALLRLSEAIPARTSWGPMPAALVVGVGCVLGCLLGCTVRLWYRRFRKPRGENGGAPHDGADAALSPGLLTPAPGGPSRLGVSAAQVGTVLARLDEALPPLLGEAISLDVLNASAGRPLLEPDRLEQVLVQLALTVRDGMPDGGIVTMRAYDGLGDVTRGDGRRTWTIIEVGKVDAPSCVPPAVRTPAASEQGMLQARQIVDAVGGRLALEQRAPGNAYFVLQLPSLAA